MLSDLLKRKKKDGKEMPEHEKSARLGVLKQISDMASDAMGNDIKGLKKVEVMASDRKGLEEGLEKAKEVVESRGDNVPGEEDSFRSNMESPDKTDAVVPSRYKEHGSFPKLDDAEEAAEGDECSSMSDDELDAQMEKFKAEKAKRSSK